jgi:hypothetical protein
MMPHEQIYEERKGECHEMREEGHNHDPVLNITVLVPVR